MIGAFALGYAGPNAEAVNMARGAAVRVFEIEDRVQELNPHCMSIFITLASRCLLLIPCLRRAANQRNQQSREQSNFETYISTIRRDPRSRYI